MSLEEDLIAGIQTDYQYLDGLEDLIYTQVATGTSFADVKAICYKWKQKEISGTLVMKKVDKVWHIFAATLSDTEPAAGDYVTDDEGNSWTIMEWHLEEIGLSLVAYRCECVKRK